MHKYNGVAVGIYYRREIKPSPTSKPRLNTKELKLSLFGVPQLLLGPKDVINANDQ